MAVVISTYDPSGEFYPSLKVVPHAGTSALKSSSQHVRIEAWLVLSEAGEGMAGISFHKDPPIFNLNWVEPGVVTVMAGVEVAAQVVVPLGGVITLKNQMPDGSYKLLNLYFEKDGTLAGVVEKLAEYLDISRDYTIKTHPLFPRYAEIETGKTGDVADVTVTNTSETDYRLIIIPGTAFENGNTDHQDMTCIETVVVLIAPGQTVGAGVFGACVHRHKAGPQEGDVLLPFRDQRWDLVKLCIVIDEVGPRSGVLQDAIWVITDDNPPKINNRDEVIQLFLAAGLNPDDYPALADHDGGSGGEI